MTAWTVARQVPLSMGFSRQEYFPLGDLPDPGIEPGSPASRADSLVAEPPVNHLGSGKCDACDVSRWSMVLRPVSFIPGFTLPIQNRQDTGGKNSDTCSGPCGT